MSCCNRKQSIDAPLASLKNKGMRLTEPRKAILQVLADEARPLSVEELHQQVNQTHNCDLATVYRNMETCLDAGILQKCMLENGKILYELVDEKDHHHHIICRKCEKTERIDLCLGGEMEAYGEKMGFSEVGHILELYGVCADCQKSKE